MTDDLVLLHCPTCDGERLAETPPCTDGHGVECPDRACVECGTALLLDAPLAAVASAGSGGRTASRGTRHAA